MPKSQPQAGSNGTGHPDASEPQGGCYVLSLSVENVRCFGPKQTLDLSDGNGRPAQWTIVLGENGTGKTTLLQALASFNHTITFHFEAKRPPVTESVTGFGPRISAWDGEWSTVVEFDRCGLLRDVDPATPAKCNVMVLTAPSLNRNDALGTPIEVSWELTPTGSVIRCRPEPKFCAYGAGRRLGRGLLSQAERDDPAGTLFDEHATLRNAEEWLLRLDYSSSKPSDVRQQQKERLEQVKQLLVSILPDVEDIRFTMPAGPNPTPRVEFETFSGWVPLRRLGYGYQTLIAWVTDFASRMVERYPDSPDPLMEPAVVVVDEIDLHLHPAWQRRLIGFLSERFPNTQFIATAHSPLVVQAAENANLAVLKRVGDHVEIINDVDEIRGWRIDQILTSDLFGLKSARPPEVETLFTRKQELLDKAKLTARAKTELQEIQDKIDKLPVGDTARTAKELDTIRQALELLTSQKPK